jgi:hypothetical protein
MQYNKTFPLSLPVAKYPPFGEKSMQLTYPSGVLAVGQLENTLLVGT